MMPGYSDVIRLTMRQARQLHPGAKLEGMLRINGKVNKNRWQTI